MPLDWWSFQDVSPNGARPQDLPDTVFTHFFKFSGGDSQNGEDYAYPAPKQLDPEFIRQVKDLCFPYGTSPLFAPPRQEHYFHHIQVTSISQPAKHVARGAKPSTGATPSESSRDFLTLRGTVLTFFQKVSATRDITFSQVVQQQALRDDFVDFLIDALTPEVRIAVEFYSKAVEFFGGCSDMYPYDSAFVDTKLSDEFKQAATQVIGSAYEVIDVGSLDTLVEECLSLAQNESASKLQCGSALWLRLNDALRQLYDNVIDTSFRQWKDTLPATSRVHVQVPIALCLLSAHASMDLISTTLYEVAALLRSDTGNSLQLSKLAPFLVDRVPVPPAACQGVVFEIPGSRKVLSFRSEAANALPQLRTNVTKLFDTVSITGLIRIFTALVREQSIIVFANTVEEASVVVSSLETLLFPLRWPGVVVPSLPQCASITSKALKSDSRPFLLGLDKMTAIRYRGLLDTLLRDPPPATTTTTTTDDNGETLHQSGSREVVLFDLSRFGEESDAFNSSDEYVRRLAKDSSHRHILDPQFEYGHAKVAEPVAGGETGDPKAWKRMSMTGLHLRDRARRWIGKLKKKAQDAKDARRRKKEAKAIARSSSALMFEGDNKPGSAGSRHQPTSLRYKYPQDLDSLDANAFVGIRAIRRWLGLDRLASSAADQNRTPSQTVAARVSWGSGSSSPTRRVASRQHAAHSNQLDLLPRQIGTLLLNDLHRVSEFVADSPEQAQSGIEGRLLQTSFLSFWAAVLRAYRTIVVTDMDAGHQHIAVKKLASGSSMLHTGLEHADENLPSSSSAGRGEAQSNASASKHLCFFQHLVQTRMFHTFLQEFHVPEFLSASGIDKDSIAASPAAAGQRTVGTMLKINRIALFDAAVDGLNLLDQDFEDAALTAAQASQPVDGANTKGRGVRSLAAVDPSFIESPAFDVCAERLVFSSLGHKGGLSLSGDSPKSSSPKASLPTGDYLLNADEDELRVRQRQFLERVLVPQGQYLGHEARLHSGPLFENSALAHEDGLAIVEARAGVLLWGMQRRFLQIYDGLASPVRDCNLRLQQLRFLCELIDKHVGNPIVARTKAAADANRQAVESEASTQLSEAVWNPAARFIEDTGRSVVAMLQGLNRQIRLVAEATSPLHRQLDFLQNSARHMQDAIKRKFTRLMSKRQAHSAVLHSLTRQDHRTLRWLEESKDVRLVREPYSVYIGSWNVNAKVVSEDALVGLEKWIIGSQLQGGRGLPDIYAIGLQEMVDLSAKNVLISGKLSADKAREWAALIEQCLNKHTGNSSGATAGHKAASSAGRGRYVEVAVQNMVGLCLLVFVREDLRRQHVVEVAVSKVGIGIMGHGGNKGAVAVRFRVHDTSFCFVCTHLAAHRNNVEGRNKDVEAILQKLHFSPQWASTSTTRHNYEAFRRRCDGVDEPEDELASAAGDGEVLTDAGGDEGTGGARAMFQAALEARRADQSASPGSSRSNSFANVAQAAVDANVQEAEASGSSPGSPSSSNANGDRKQLSPKPKSPSARRRRSSLQSASGKPLIDGVSDPSGIPTTERRASLSGRRSSGAFFKLLRSASAAGLLDASSEAGNGIDVGGGDSGPSSPRGDADDGSSASSALYGGASNPSSTSGGGGGGGGGGANGPQDAEVQDADFGNKITVLDHDIVFWFGDLNYRLQKKVQNEVAFAKIFDGTWDELLSIDQLNLERGCNRVFAPFRGINVKYGPGRGKMQHEARLRRLQQSGRALERSLAMWLESPPAFTPTYKYRPGTGKYDLRGTPWDPDSKGGKMRCPAWCDRILWRAPDGYVVQHTYGDCEALVHSDHRPVGSRFTVRTDVNERLSPAVAVAARKGVERLEAFLAALGHAPSAADGGSSASPRASVNNNVVLVDSSSSSLSPASAAVAADDDLDREDELRFFARNVSLVVLRPSELKAELELAQASVAWGWRLPACLAHLEDLMRGAVQYKVDYLLSYKQVQIELANHVLQFFTDMEVHIDLLVEQHADASSASPEISATEKAQRVMLGNAGKWRQSHKHVMAKLAQLRDSLAHASQCEADLKFLADGFAGSARGLKNQLQQARNAIDRDTCIGEPRTEAFLRTMCDTLDAFWTDFEAAKKPFSERMATVNGAASEALARLTQDVEEKYSAIASSSQELQRLQVQQHTSDTAVNTNQTVLQREHRTHFEECQPQIHSIRVHRCDFKAQLMEETRDSAPLRWKSNNRLIKKQGRHAYLFEVPRHLKDAFAAAGISEGEQLLAVNGVSCVGLPYREIMSQIERMFLTDEDEKAFAGSDEAAAEAVRRMASRTLEFSFGPRETAARDVIWLIIKHEKEKHATCTQRISEINESHDDLVSSLCTTLKKTERELRIVVGRKTRNTLSAWGALVAALKKLLPPCKAAIGDLVRSFETYDCEAAVRSLVSSDAALCKIVGFPATTLGTAAAAASPSAFGARTYSRARANTDANGSYSYPLRQPLIFQLHYQGIGSVRFLMDRLRDTGKQLKKLKDYFLARVESTQKFIKAFDACGLSRRDLIESGFGDGGKLASAHFPAVSQVFHLYHQVRMCSTGYEHLGYSQAALKIAHLLATLNEVLTTFECHLTSIQREYCDAQGRYARSLQQRHVNSNCGGSGLDNAPSDSSSEDDDYCYFEYLNASEVQDICAKQLLGHLQRYEVYWRVKLEGIVKTDLLAVLVKGSDPETLAAMTTERPSAPKFDMGNPKDEDKGSPDDGDKKKKKTKDKKGASTNEQVLQAQALFDCAVVRTEQAVTLQKHLDTLIECERVHAQELEELASERGPLASVSFSFAPQGQSKCFFKLYLQRVDAWNREQIDARVELGRQMTRCSVLLQDCSLRNVVESFKDVLASPEDNLSMMASVGQQISDLLTAAEGKTQRFVKTMNEAISSFQKLTMSGMARRRAAALLRAHGHSRLNEQLRSLALAAGQYGAAQECSHVTGPSRFSDQRLALTFCGYIDSQLTGVKDLVCNGLVTKTVGSSSKQRVLVLTNTPLLVYMVPDTGEIKGEIDWTDTVYAKLVDGTQDHFKVCTPERTFHLAASSGETPAADWVIRINRLAIEKFGRLKPEAVEGGRLEARFLRWKTFSMGEEATLSV